MRNVDAGQRVVGQQLDLAAVGAVFQGPPKAQTGDGTSMSTRVNQDRP